MHARTVLLPLCLTGALLTGLSAPAVAAVAAPPRAAVDTDRDGMPNTWEVAHKLDPKKAADARADIDQDGLNNLTEYKLRTSPRDEDTDDDGHDDADERTTRTNPTVADTDRDGVPDGDEDHDRDGIANEDEDDARESCAGDDDDLDGDFVADEDENELRLAVNDADADDDGVVDGEEDHNRDGEANEDEDDVAGDRCDGDRDRDGRPEEDDGDTFGVIASFDAATGALAITGTTLTFRVTAGTEIDVEVITTDDEGEQDTEDREGTTADLAEGTEVVEVDVERGTLEEITLRSAAS